MPVTAPTTLFAHLVDDAALFPPARDPMDVAVSGHLRRREDTHQWIMGRFLCPGTRIGELSGTFDGAAALDLGLILREATEKSALDFAADDPNLHLTGIELGPGFGDPESVLDGDVAVYQEVDRARRLAPQLDRIADLGVAAKLRTGGLRAEAFPPSEEVATFIEGCIERVIGFKCTAGLHHAVPYTDSETGFGHHGFLNIILATHAILTGGDPVDVLNLSIGGELAGMIASLTSDQSETIRTSYHGHGSCVFSDAADDLVKLGLV